MLAEPGRLEKSLLEQAESLVWRVKFNKTGLKKSWNCYKVRWIWNQTWSLGWVTESRVSVNKRGTLTTNSGICSGWGSSHNWRRKTIRKKNICVVKLKYIIMFTIWSENYSYRNQTIIPKKVKEKSKLWSNSLKTFIIVGSIKLCWWFW